MKPWKPRPYNQWPEELKRIRNLPNKKWDKAIAKIFVFDEMQGVENIEKQAKHTQRLDKREENPDNSTG